MFESINFWILRFSELSREFSKNIPVLFSLCFLYSVRVSFPESWTSVSERKNVQYGLSLEGVYSIGTELLFRKCYFGKTLESYIVLFIQPIEFKSHLFCFSERDFFSTWNYTERESIKKNLTSVGNFGYSFEFELYPARKLFHFFLNLQGLFSRCSENYRGFSKMQGCFSKIFPCAQSEFSRFYQKFPCMQACSM